VTAAKKVPAPKPLPCPFCGCKPHVDRNNWGEHRVVCENGECETTPNGYWRNSRADAIAAWNRRAK
jgi:hypothetical protein